MKSEMFSWVVVFSQKFCRCLKHFMREVVSHNPLQIEFRFGCILNGYLIVDPIVSSVMEVHN